RDVATGMRRGVIDARRRLVAVAALGLVAWPACDLAAPEDRVPTRVAVAAATAAPRAATPIPLLRAATAAPPRTPTRAATSVARPRPSPTPSGPSDEEQMAQVVGQIAGALRASDLEALGEL